jgi:hypothetical protein
MKIFFKNFLPLFLLCSCSTLRDSLLLGGTTGLVVGGYTGSIAPTYDDKSAKSENIAAGIAVGVGVGVLGAYILHKQMEERQNKVAPVQHDPKIHFGELPPNPFTPPEPVE